MNRKCSRQYIKDNIFQPEECTHFLKFNVGEYGSENGYLKEEAGKKLNHIYCDHKDEFHFQVNDTNEDIGTVLLNFENPTYTSDNRCRQKSNFYGFNANRFRPRQSSLFASDDEVDNREHFDSNTENLEVTKVKSADATETKGLLQVSEKRIERKRCLVCSNHQKVFLQIPNWAK
ncbi:hypothetical protein ACOME3_004088 [Neoechinorhynchus agilis]